MTRLQCEPGSSPAYRELVANKVLCLWLSRSTTRLSQSCFTSQPTFQPLCVFGLAVARYLPVESKTCVFTWKEALATEGHMPVEGLFKFRLDSSTRKQKAEEKLVNRWMYIDGWKESKRSLVNEVECMLGSWLGLCQVSVSDLNNSLCLPWVDVAAYVSELLWCTLGTVPFPSYKRNLHRFVAQLLCQTALYWGHFKLYAQQQWRLRELNTTRHLVFPGWLSHRPKCLLSSWCTGTLLAKPEHQCS